MVDTVRYLDTDAAGGGDGSEGSPYNSGASWIANEAGNIGSGDRHILNVRTPTNPDVSYWNLGGFTGSGVLIIQLWGASSKFTIRPGSGSGHAITYSSSPGLTINIFDFIIDMADMDGGSEEGVRLWCSGRLDRFLIKNGTLDASMDAITWPYNDFLSATHIIANGMIHDVTRGGVMNQRSHEKNTTITNLTLCNIGAGGATFCAVGYDSNFTPTNSSMTIINTAADLQGGSSGSCFLRDGSNGGIAGTSDYNYSGDGTAATLFGANSVGNVTFQDTTGGTGDRAMFVSLSAPVDLHILDDPGNILRAGGAGPTDPSLGILVTLKDYDLDDRAGLTCDAGADEYTSTGPIDIAIGLGFSAGLAPTGRIPNPQGAVGLGFTAGLAPTGRIPNPQGAAALGFTAGLSADIEKSGGIDIAIGLGFTAGLGVDGRIPNLQAGTDLGFTAGLGADGRIPNLQAGIDLGFTAGLSTNGIIGTVIEIAIGLGFAAGLGADGRMASLEGGIPLDFTAGLGTDGRIPDLQGLANLGFNAGLEAAGRLPNLGAGIDLDFTAGLNFLDADNVPVFRDLNERVADALNNDAFLQSLVGNQIWNIFRREINEKPAVVFFRESTIGVNSSMGTNALVGGRFQFDCYAKTLELCAQIKRAVEDVIIRDFQGIFLNRVDRYNEQECSYLIQIEYSLWGYDRNVGG